MQSISVFMGIDVACAKRKRLPICAVAQGFPLRPLPIPKQLVELIPLGVGNREIIETAPFHQAAQGVVGGIDRILNVTGWNLKRIAIDAPAAAPTTGSRSSEVELARCGLSSFLTPALHEWTGIREKCIEHLRLGGTAAKLPYANKIWMLFGFELFSQLRSQDRGEVIEVYPYAIVPTLAPTCEHKSTEKGYLDQLAAVACRRGWEPGDLEAKLKATVSGNRHDRLDAFMAAWVASLPADERRAFGDARRPNDAIWVPAS